MADMIKFYKGLEASLPDTGVNGALYITTDEGAIYLGTGTGMKRLGDFVQVASVSALPAKAHESCLYYCVAENILAKWNGTEWKQINKQPTAEELKTLLGLGAMAYKSEVAEGDLSTALKEKVNAAAEGNHSHANKTVLDGITADKVSAWDSAKADAIAHADGLNTAMNTRVEALEAVDHEHANKALLDTYTQTEANLADAVAKKHAHDNKSVLDGITAAKVSAWDAAEGNAKAYADGLDSAMDARVDALEAKFGGGEGTVEAQITAAVEALDVTDTVVDGQYVSSVSQIDGKVVVTRADLPDYSTTYDAYGAAAAVDAKLTEEVSRAKAAEKANADAITAIKDGATVDSFADVEAELAKKVDKVEGKSLIADTEIARLAGMSDGANKVESSNTNGSIKIDGVDTVVYTHPEKHAIDDVTGLADAIADAKKAGTDAAGALEAYKTSNDAALAGVKTTAEQGVADAADVAANLATHITEAGNTYETKTDAADKLTEAKGYTDTEVAKVQGAVDAIEADYLKAADKTELSNAIAAEKTRAEGAEAALDARLVPVETFLAAAELDADDKNVIDTLKEIQEYIKSDETGAAEMLASINANAAAIEAEVARAKAAEEANAKDIATLQGAVETINSTHEADIAELEGTITAGDEATLASAKGYAEAQVKALEDGKVANNAAAIATNATAIAENTAAIATKANSVDVYLKTETYSQSEVNALLTWGDF